MEREKTIAMLSSPGAYFMKPLDMLATVGDFAYFGIRAFAASFASLLLPAETLRQLYRVLIGALPIASLAGLAIGLVLWMHLRGVILRTQGAGREALLFLPTAVALAVVLEFAPLAAGLIVAGRTGASLGAVALWSTGPIFIKYLAGTVDSWSQNALRYSVAFLFWFPFLLYVIRKGALDPRTWRRAVLPSVANVVMQSLYAAAFYHIDPGFLTLLSNTSVLWVAGFSLALFPEERPLILPPRFNMVEENSGLE